MHPRISEVLSFLDTQRAALTHALDGIPAAVRSRRPAPDRWSIAEVLAHMAAVEGQVIKLLQIRITAARHAGLGAEHDSSPVVPTVDLAHMLDRSRPLTASAAAQPPEGIDATAAWTTLASRREMLRAVLTGADGLALGEIVAPNPVLGPLNAYQWVVFVGGHEARHTAQIRETAAALGAQQLAR